MVVVVAAGITVVAVEVLVVLVVAGGLLSSIPITPPISATHTRSQVAVLSVIVGQAGA